MVQQYVFVNHDSSGDNQLRLRDVKKPHIKASNEVLVRIRAVSLNYRDVRLLIALT
jgi:NADPH:quinone reductase-like Zn-dependent oxidoreductase